jgi:hypothetical protein
MINFDPAICRILRDQTLQSIISANSKQNPKIFYDVNLGPRGQSTDKK